MSVHRLALFTRTMDVVFLAGVVDPQRRNYRPFATYQLSWYLRQHGYESQVVNFIHQAPEKLIREALAKYITPKTKILGLGLMTHPKDQQATIKKVESILYWAKKTYPHVKIVAGGPLTSFLVRHYRNKMLFDYIFYGHAENTLLELCDHLWRGGDHPKVTSIQGNDVIDENAADPKKIRFNIEQSRFEWHDSDHIQEGETLPLELGRGCVFACRFCSYPYIGKKVNDFNRSMDCIENELRRNYDKWKITNYYMLDDTINASHERNVEFYKMTQRLPFKIQFAGYCRMDLLAKRPDSEMMLFESGLRGVYFGLETFNQDAADLIKKGWNARNAKQFLPKLHHEIWKKRVGVQCGLIAGLPPQGFEELKDTNRWMIDHEINHWQWHRLGINREKNSLFTSEFDRNAESYGFDWYVDNGQLYWKTQYATQRDAENWVSQLVAEATPHFKYACWNLMEIVQYQLELPVMVNVVRASDPFRNKISLRRRDFLTNYWSQLLGRKVTNFDFQ